MNKFYTYLFLDPRKPGKYNYGNYTFDYEPFYVGKGIGDRYLIHLKETRETAYNPYKFNKIQKILNLNMNIEYYFINNLSEDEAFKNEIELINLIGRIDLNNGVLTNLTNGGDAPPRFDELREEIKLLKIEATRKVNKGRKISDETRKKMSGKTPWNKNKTNIYSNETLKKMSLSKKGKRYAKATEFKTGQTSPMKGKKHTEESKQKLSEINFGKKMDNETKKKISNKLSGENNPMYGKNLSNDVKNKISNGRKGKNVGESNHKSRSVLQYDLNGNFIMEWQSINQAQKLLNITHISCVCNNKRNHAGGYKWIYKN